MRLVYSDRYRIDLGPHVFPTAKYAFVCARVLAAGLVPPGAQVEPGPAAWGDLELVHTSEYLQKIRSGDLSPAEVAQLELPWSEAVVEGFRLMSGGTVLAARLAAADGGAVHLGGGFHHAFPNHGEGFCLFNDVAVAIRRLQHDRLITTAAVIDCDVHQGNGTAFVFQGDPAVFTFSIHQQHNYPLFKPRGSLDIGLPDGAGDGQYLDALAEALPQTVRPRRDLAFYLAGADPFGEDQLGGLALTRAGLRERDRLVLDTLWQAGMPVAVVLAGGYATRLEDTVEIHVATVEEACRQAAARTAT